METEEEGQDITVPLIAGIVIVSIVAVVAIVCAIKIHQDRKKLSKVKIGWDLEAAKGKKDKGILGGRAQIGLTGSLPSPRGDSAVLLFNSLVETQ